MGQFASAGPTLHAPTRQAGAPLLLRVRSMAGGRMRAMPFVVAVA